MLLWWGYKQKLAAWREGIGHREGPPPPETERKRNPSASGEGKYSSSCCHWDQGRKRLPKTNRDSRREFSCHGRKCRNIEKASFLSPARRHGVHLSLRLDQDKRPLMPPRMCLAPGDKHLATREVARAGEGVFCGTGEQELLEADRAERKRWVKPPWWPAPHRTRVYWRRSLQLRHVEGDEGNKLVNPSRVLTEGLGLPPQQPVGEEARPRTGMKTMPPSFHSSAVPDAHKINVPKWWRRRWRC